MIRLPRKPRFDLRKKVTAVSFQLLIAVAIFGVTILHATLIHELGHAFLARRNGAPIEQIHVGVPPRLFGFGVGNTAVHVNVLPVGGRVLIGDPEENLGFLTDVRIALAGPAANFITGFMLLLALEIRRGFGITAPFHAVKLAIEAISTDFDQLKLAIHAVSHLQLAELVGHGNAFALHGLLEGSSGTYSAFEFALALGAAVHFVGGVYNLIPLPPFDGGQILTSGLGAIFRREVHNHIVDFLRLGGLAIIAGAVALSL